MKILSESLNQLIRENISVFYDFENGCQYFNFETLYNYDAPSHEDLDRLTFKSANNFIYDTKIVQENQSSGNVLFTFTLGDTITSNWLSNNNNSLFDGFNFFGICILKGQFVPYNYGYISNNDLMCEIYTFSGFKFDPEKVKCLGSYVNFYNTYAGPTEKRHLILDQFYDDILADIKRSENSVDDMRAKLYAAKLANDPDILANY